MATTAQISLDTYLNTSYTPDMDYVAGELEDRNVGEFDHNMVQQAILFWFSQHRKEWNIRAVQEQRTRLASATVRIPDVSIFSREIPIEQVFTRPQLIAIEVLSPNDRHARMDEKIRDYIQFGVPHIWVINPQTRIGWDCSNGNWVRAERLEAANTPMYPPLPEIFTQIDEDSF